MTMQLLRHVAYQSAGVALHINYHSLRGEMTVDSSGFMELDTEIHRNVMTARGIHAIRQIVRHHSNSTIEGPADDRLQSLLVGRILDLAHVAPRAV